MDTEVEKPQGRFTGGDENTREVHYPSGMVGDIYRSQYTE